jgi:predicted Rdx family selenoprotein
LVWSRTKGASVPEMKALKAKLRDVISPEKSLGHSEPA